MPTLRDATIRLAYDKPELRSYLLPVLVRTAEDPLLGKLKALYMKGMPELRGLREAIAELKRDASFRFLETRKDLDDLLEHIDQIKRDRTVEDHFSRAREINELATNVKRRESSEVLENLKNLDSVIKITKLIQATR